jgi:hypothetical protein
LLEHRKLKVEEFEHVIVGNLYSIKGFGTEHRKGKMYSCRTTGILLTYRITVASSTGFSPVGCSPLAKIYGYIGETPLHFSQLTKILLGKVGIRNLSTPTSKPLFLLFDVFPRGVRIPFSKEPARKIVFVLFRTRRCLNIAYISFYNKPLGVPENRQPARVP